jgi:hypothetical protein
MSTELNTFTLTDINPRGEDLQIGVVDPAVIEDLYKRLIHDFCMKLGERPPIDTTLNVRAKVMFNFDPDTIYHCYGVDVMVDYQLFESLCGGVFTTLIGSNPYAELAITISDAIKYGIVKRTENPDVFEICDGHNVDVDESYPLYNVDALLRIYDGIGWEGNDYIYIPEANTNPYTMIFQIWVEIIPDPVMTKGATKV